MNTNFSRPCLGINQSSLFQMSDGLATSSLSRSEFAQNPAFILNKYDIPLSSKKIEIKMQKTSEICVPELFICTSVVVQNVDTNLSTVFYVVASASLGYETTLSVEVDGYAMTSPLSKDNYNNIC